MRLEAKKAEILNEEVQVELDQVQAAIEKHKRQDRLTLLNFESVHLGPVA